MATKLSKMEVKGWIKKGVKDMETLYRKMHKKGATAKVPATFAPAIEKMFEGADPFAPAPVKERKPRKPAAFKIAKKRPVYAAVKAGANTLQSLHAALAPSVTMEEFTAAIVKAFGSVESALVVKATKAKVKVEKTTPFRPGSKYQRIVDLCVSGGGNGQTVAEVSKLIVQAGIVAHEYQAFISLSVLRNPKQFSNRGRTSDANYGDSKGGESIVNLVVNSLTPTLPNRFGKSPETAETPETAQAGDAPAPQAGEQNDTSGDSAAPAPETAEGETAQTVEAQAGETPAPAETPAAETAETAEGMRDLVG